MLSVSNDDNLGASSGTLTLSGGTLLASSGFALSASRPISVGTGTISVANGNLIYGGALAGSATGSLTKIGAGSLQLDGAETFAGTTTVNAGAVSGTGTLAGPLVVNGPGQVAPGDNSSGYFGGAGTLTVPSATLNGGAVLDVDLGASSDLLKVTGALTLNGGTVNVQNSGGLSTGTYEIVSYGSLTNPFNAGSLFVGNMPSGYIATIATPTGSQINLNVFAATVWSGAPRLGVGYRHAELDQKRQRRRPTPTATRWSSSTGRAPAA